MQSPITTLTLTTLSSLLLLCFISITTNVEAFYLPGVAPYDYKHGESVQLKVNKLDSVKTQLPYEFYSLPFCKPDKVSEASENLGEVLSGDKIESSLYDIKMQIPEVCKVLCVSNFSKSDMDSFADRIEDEYRVHWIVDNLPAATKYYTEIQNKDNKLEYVEHYEKGFALGFVGTPEMTRPGVQPGSKYVNNHIQITLLFHQEDKKGFRIVGFEVEPFSVKHIYDRDDKGQLTLKTCDAANPVHHGVEPQAVSDPSSDYTLIVWTYDVQWRSSEIKWASRWDLYLKMTDPNIHWFSIINSIMIVLFLSGMIAMILMRTLHRDFIRYNQIEEPDQAAQEETGWKLIYGDVFRPPQNGGFFAVLVGSGVQVFCMTLLTLVFAALGFLSPANRGSLMTVLLLLFVFMGVFAGYYATMTYKLFKLAEWSRNTFFTAIFFPGVCFAIFFVLDLFIWSQKSSGAVPISTLVALLVLWFGISMPLVYIGSYFAFKKPELKLPVKVNMIPRMVPDQPWYMQPQFSILVGGVLPFGAVFIEIFFIMSSVWLHQFYYAFAILFIVFLILIITCAEITIVMCYFQLCGEDYHWWWRSYLTAGSSALYLFLYSVLYFFTKLEIVKFIPGLLFFGYMSIVSFAFFLLTGTIGYFACFNFIYKIYSSIKVE